MRGALLICGTHSDAGKSVVVAGICRWLHRNGVRVAPFKAQNMALNSIVTDDGSEIGRAQGAQAAAAGIEPAAAMNPILLKPTGEGRSQVVVMGRPHAEVTAREYQDMKHELRPFVMAALRELRESYDVVVCEGAGSPAEINLRDGDLVNMGLARAAGLPVILVGDIDRGGVFASLYGTLAVLESADRAMISAFVINKFRGDETILAPGLERLEAMTGRSTIGVLPWAEDLWLDAEDSLSLSSAHPGTCTGPDPLEVAVVRLRWMSNATDLDPLSVEPGVRVRFTRSVDEIRRADLVVVPGSKATVDDLEGLRAEGIADALTWRGATGAPVVGVCAGYQMLGERIDDDVESMRGRVPGLGLLPVTTAFARDKVLRRRSGWCSWLGTDASGYEIRHGRVRLHGGQPVFADPGGEPDGCRVGNVVGTSWHGVLEHDGFRRSLLAWVAAARGRTVVPGTASFAARRERQLDVLGDLIGSHVDTSRLRAIIESGAHRVAEVGA